ncbi:MltA domain-containing protein [Leptospira paudalimensis]|uniref:peptidoglycan lytic exotransglycosylase n=1 Tax=Leptospira paudalimensis TaxID=2950024 RepID=A0ABT3MAL9_9LEPT|nr:MltA domain-containing protein [Leptospira paudalimensis]MCW7505432.1 MltA domain-containing protein [Leptospira paudalimensis]
MKRFLICLFSLYLVPFLWTLPARPTKPNHKILDKKSESIALQVAIQESIQYLQKLPMDTKFLIQGETITLNDILFPLREIQKQIQGNKHLDLLKEIRKQFKEVELKPNSEPPLITGYYEVRIQGRSKPSGNYLYPALVPPKQNSKATHSKFYPREYWKEESHWKTVSRPIVYLTLTDLHLAQLEGSALVQTETKEIFRINYASDNGFDYLSPAVHLTGVCPSLKPYELKFCMETNPKEVSEAIWKNPRYIFFEKENLPNKQLSDLMIGPLGSGGIRLVPERSVAMDKQIPLGFPVLISFKSIQQTYNDHLVFVHDRGNAIQGEGRVDFYLGNETGIDKIANHLLTKGKVILFVPKKEK